MVVKMDLYQQIFFTTLALAFGLLHYILFLYNRHLKSNLYFALFAFFYAANIFFDFQTFIVAGSEIEFLYLRIHRGLMPYNSIFALLFLYSILESKIPVQFWLISLGFVVASIFAVYDPINNFHYLLIFNILVLIEAVRIIGAGINQKKESAWIIAIGFTFLFIFSSYDLFMDLGIIESIYHIHNGYPFGFAGLIISMSVYLASDFAKTNEKMLRKERQAKELEVQGRLLEAEDERKSKELEEARRYRAAYVRRIG
jgi:hypothetical protein